MQADDATLSFLCKTGHDLGLPSLLSRASEKLWLALQDLLSLWEEELRRATTTAAESSRVGFCQIAELFGRQVARLERRTLALRRALAAASAAPRQKIDPSAAAG